MHSDNNSSRKSPFVGLIPYSDSDYEFFYEREEEVEGILKLLHNQQVTKAAVYYQRTLYLFISALAIAFLAIFLVMIDSLIVNKV